MPPLGKRAAGVDAEGVDRGFGGRGGGHSHLSVDVLSGGELIECTGSGVAPDIADFTRRIKP